MTSADDQVPPNRRLPVARLEEFLQALKAQNITSAEVARRTGCSVQYLSDLKGGRRTLSELFARRLQQEFGVEFEWLLGKSGSLDLPPQRQWQTPTDQSRLWLPVFSHPIAGEPFKNSVWDGSSVELAGAAAQRALRARRPYALRFGANDRRGRLQKHDVLLISQEQRAEAEIQVLREGSKMFLARPMKNGWERLAADTEVGAKVSVHGHCVGIIWASLCDP